MIESFEKTVFYRGLTATSLCKAPFIKHVRKDRKPRKFPSVLDAEADNWFLKEFGIRYRSQALFLTGSKFVAQGYASNPDNVVRVIPIGLYSCC